MGSAARSSIRPWLAWAGLAVGAGALGLVAGATGLLGNPLDTVDFAPAVVAPIDGTALLDCPGGDPVGTVPRNERVYVIARSPDSLWLAVRSVQQGYRTVWVATDSVDADEFPIRVPDLPVRACLAGEVVP